MTIDNPHVGTHQRDRFGLQVQDFDAMVIGVRHIQQLSSFTQTQASGFVEAGLQKAWAESVPSLPCACKHPALLSLRIHHFDLQQRRSSFMTMESLTIDSACPFKNLHHFLWLKE